MLRALLLAILIMLPATHSGIAQPESAGGGPICWYAPEGCPTRAAWKNSTIARAAVAQAEEDARGWFGVGQAEQSSFEARAGQFFGSLEERKPYLSGRFIHAGFSDWDGAIQSYPRRDHAVFSVLLPLAEWGNRTNSTNWTATIQHGRLHARADPAVEMVEDSAAAPFAAYTGDGSFLFDSGIRSWETLREKRLIRNASSDGYLVVTGNASIETLHEQGSPLHEPSRLLPWLRDGGAFFFQRPQAHHIEAHGFDQRLFAIEEDRLAVEGVVLGGQDDAITQVLSYGGLLRARPVNRGLELVVEHPPHRDLLVVRTDPASFGGAAPGEIRVRGGAVRQVENISEVFAPGQEAVAHVASNGTAFQVTIRLPPGAERSTIHLAPGAPHTPPPPLPPPLPAPPPLAPPPPADPPDPTRTNATTSGNDASNDFAIPGPGLLWALGGAAAIAVAARRKQPR